MAPSRRRPTDLDPDADRIDRRVPAAFPEKGELAGRYRVIRSLGSGSQGEVWLAEDRATGQRWALKTSPNARALRAEWECLVSLRNHPRFPRADRFYEEREIGGAETEAFYTMEWIDGLTLDRALPDMGVQETRRLFLGACSALAFMHDAGWIHGDVKPANLLVLGLSDSPEVRLIDFSLSRKEGGEICGWIRGTPHFAAPAILRGEPADRTSDLYSLGKSFLDSDSVAAGDSELKDILQRMVEPEVGARFAAVSAVLGEARFFADKDRFIPAMDASRASPPFVDFGSRVEATLREIRHRCSLSGSRSEDRDPSSGLLHVGFDPGTGRTRFLVELRRRLLAERIETVIAPSGENPTGLLKHAAVVLACVDPAEDFGSSNAPTDAGCVVVVDRGVCDLPCDGGSFEELQTIACAVLGHQVERQSVDADAIVKCTQGFVSWTVAASRALVDMRAQGLFPFELREVIGASVPEPVRTLLESRLSISPDMVEPAGRLALAELPFTREQAASITGSTTLWDELVDAKIITCLDEGSAIAGPRARFNKVHDVLLLSSTLSFEKRKLGHAAWLQTVEHSGGENAFAVFVHGLRSGNTAAMLRAGRIVMRASLEGLRPGEAVRALDCIREAQPGSVADWLGPRELADYYELAGDALSAHRSAEEALGIYGKVPDLIGSDSNRQLRLLRKRAVCLDALGNHQGAFDLLRAGIEDAFDVAWNEKVQAIERLGEFSCKLGDNTAAEDWLRRGLDTDGIVVESLEVSRLWNNLGIVAGLRGDTQASRDHHQKALGIRERLDDQDGISRSLTNLAWADLRSGNLVSAEGRVARALGIKRRLRQLATATPAMSLLSEIHVRRGQFADAIALNTEISHLRGAAGHSEGEVSGQLELAELWFALGRIEEARQHSDEGLAILARTGLRTSFLPASLLFRARLEAGLGRIPEVERLARKVIAEAEGTGSEEYSISARSLLLLFRTPPSVDDDELARLEARSTHLPEGRDRIVTLLDITHASLAGEDSTRALRLAKLAVQESREHQVEPLYLKARLLEARAHFALRRSDSHGASLLHEVAEGADRLGLLELRWQTYAALADMHADAGRSDRALVWLGRCTEVFSQVIHHMQAEEMVDDYLGAPERVRIFDTLEARLSLEPMAGDSLGER